MMKKLTLILLLLSFFQAATYAQSTCATAPNLTGSMTGSFNTGDQYAWFTVSSDDSLLEIVYQSQVSYTSGYGAVDLFEGSCGNLTLVQHIDSIPSVDTLDLTVPATGQNYLLRITRYDVKNQESFTIEKEINNYWNNYFTDQNGNLVTNCVSLYPVHAGEPGIPVGINGCDEIIVCLNDILHLHLNCYNDPGSTYSCYGSTDPSTGYLFSDAFLIVANGAQLTQVNGSSYDLSFTQLGDLQFQILPNGITQTGNYPPNANAFTFTVHVVDAPPAGTWDNNILCASGTATLTASPGSTITSAQVDGQNIPHTNTTFQVSASNYSAGTHTVTYTLSSNCGTATYTTSFQVIEEMNESWNVDQCGNATFTFYTCNPTHQQDYVLINWGDGTTTQGVTLTNGSITLTHHYPPGSYNSSVAVSPLVNGSSPYYSNNFSATVYAQPLTLAGSAFACEGKLGIYIVNPPAYSTIVWEANPPYPFSGQGTTQISPSSSWASTLEDVVVTVTLTDLNGCVYVGEWVVQACCANQNQQLPANEYFERTYYTHTNTSSGLNNKLPAGAYGGPTGVQISNPAPPNLPLITTGYSNPTTISQFINSYQGQAGISWTPGTNSLTISRTVYFNNDLIIDQNISLTQSNYLRFGPNSRIIVNPGVTLTMARNTLAPYCGEMWGGIKMVDNSSSINIQTTNIIGAIAGIYVYGNGTASVSTSNFIDNYEGVVINSRTVDFTQIIDCYFGDATDVNLLPPYDMLKATKHGVHYIQSRNQTIGQNSTATGSGNLFHNIQKGIKIENSTVNIDRNTFYAIQETLSPTEFGAGIDISGGKLTTSIVQLGTNPQYFNSFYGCEIGVYDAGLVKLTSRNDLMKDVKYYGYQLLATTNFTSHNIQYNQINSASKRAYGVYLKDFGAATNLIAYNIFNEDIGPALSAGYDFNRSVYIGNINSTAVNNTQVLNNTIRWSRVGIHILNTNAALVQSNTIYMDWANSRYLTNFPITAVTSTGILVENSPKCYVYTNTVSHNNLPLGIDDSRLIGIKVSQSSLSRIWKNHMTRVAAGFYAYGSSWTSKVECNVMTSNNHGFYMDQAEIGGQGWPGWFNIPAYGANNQWITNLTQDGTVGTMVFTNSNSTPYIHSAFPPVLYNSDPSQFMINPGHWNDISIATQNNSCGTATNLQPIEMLPQAAQRQQQLSNVVTNQQLFTTLDGEMKHYIHQHVFANLIHDPGEVNMGSTDDQLYADYVSTNVPEQSRIQVQAADLMAAGDPVNAQLLIDQYETTTLYNSTLKTVQTIWNQWLLTGDTITVADSLTLYDIACSDPLFYGTGVYVARNILDWDGECQQPAQIAVNQSSEETVAEKTASVTIAPNPNKGSFKIVSDQELVHLSVFALNGQLIWESTDAVGQIQLDLEPGIYLLKSVNSDNEVITTRFAVE